MRRVVITGLGMVSPLGMGVDHNWSAITAGKSGIRKIDEFDASDITSQIAGIVPKTDDENPSNGAFNANLYVDPKEQRKIDRFTVFALAAAEEALQDSGYSGFYHQLYRLETAALLKSLKCLEFSAMKTSVLRVFTPTSFRSRSSRLLKTHRNQLPRF